MKVLMLCDYPLTPSDINGGVAAAGYNLVHALLETTDMEIVVAGFWPGFDEPNPKVIEQDRLRIIRCPAVAPRAHLRNYRKERKLFDKIVRDEIPDIVHAQGEGIYASVAVNSGLPSVYTIHGIRLKELEMTRAEIGLASYFLRTRLIRKHHAKATDIVAINRYTEKAIEDVHSARVRIIHNAVDEVFFGLYSDAEKPAGRLLQVGGVRSRKDIPTLLRAVAAIHEQGLPVSLDVVGPNDDDSLSEAEKFIYDQELSEIVRIRGLVSASELEELYASADIFVMSSVEESSPIAIVQAMAAGLPVISTEVGGISEMVADSENSFLVSPGEWGLMAEKLGMLINDRQLRSSFSAKSRKLALDDWSTKSVARKTYEMYKEIISEC